ncbi:alpha/beta hydrolase [Paraburkholderia humisilvae]|uniref:Carboxylesterase NlhH n=1 Tax=Paraburkholderia humisilvae TaxID=627669 RepID=A0A6J5EGK4_9BURK|nr:alpha/beta hydrolase [Paraburkholderia humisilvae]CAB3764322.1 Carboxylesterase NlhH [Paraburkholderia humisilvae]
MSLHPNFRELLDRLKHKKSPIGTLPVALARQYFDFYTPLCDIDPPPLPHVEDIEVPARDGTSLKARLYCYEQPNWWSPLPVLLYFHSGGFVFGRIETAEAQCRSLALEARCAVLSIDYRLAPEFRFPTAIDDALDSLIWVQRNAHALGLDPHRIAVGGESAGANLAAVTAVNARDLHIRLAMQLLVYPGLSRRHDLDSHLSYGEGYSLTIGLIRRLQKLYLRNAQDTDDWRFAPLDAALQPANGYGNLAPALFLSAQYDPLIDEQFLYANKLLDAGNSVHMCCYPGMIHGFFSMSRFVEAAAQARAEAGQSLRRAFRAIDG